MSGNPKTKARRVAAAGTTLERIRAAGCTVSLIHAVGRQYRVQAPDKGSVEFFLSTERWYATHDPGMRGKGLESMLAAVLRLEPPAPKREHEKLSLPMVTVFADASFDHRDRTGGWGCWVKADGSQSGLTHGGPLATCTSSQDAELQAICNALAFAEQQRLLPTDGVVLVQSDCMEALSMILWKIPAATNNSLRGAPVHRARRPTKKLKESDGLLWIAQWHADRQPGIRLQVRHVKGHQKQAVGRGWVNQQCDLLAKAGRKAAAAQKREATL